MNLKKLTLSTLLISGALNAMEDTTNSTRTRFLRSRGPICSATIVDRLGVELPPEEHGTKRGPYHIAYEYTDKDSDDSAKIPTVHYTVTQEGREILKEHKEIPLNSITFIQLDHERNYLTLWCSLPSSQLLERLRQDQMNLLTSQPFSTFTRTVIKLLNTEK